MGKSLKIAAGLISVLLVRPAIRASAANASVNITSYQYTDSVSGSNVSTINAGESVTWTWLSTDHDHSTTSGTCTSGGGAYGEPDCIGDGLWDSGKFLAPHSFTRVFPVAGNFAYYCQVHGNVMTGRVIVNTVAPPPPPPPTPSVCTPSATVLCIDDQPGDKRFQVVASFQTSQNGGQSGQGQAIPLSGVGVTHGGVLWFFSADNPELLVKVLNTCSFSGHIWVFASAGTNVGVTLTVIDTKTGVQKIYTNPDIHNMPPIADTEAFATCP